MRPFPSCYLVHLDQYDILELRLAIVGLVVDGCTLQWATAVAATQYHISFHCRSEIQTLRRIHTSLLLAEALHAFRVGRHCDLDVCSWC